MRFWDASALLPLVVAEAGSEIVDRRLADAAEREALVVLSWPDR